MNRNRVNNADLSGIDDFMSQAEPGSNKNYDTMS